MSMIGFQSSVSPCPPSPRHLQTILVKHPHWKRSIVELMIHSIVRKVSKVDDVVGIAMRMSKDTSHVRLVLRSYAHIALKTSTNFVSSVYEKDLVTM